MLIDTSSSMINALAEANEKPLRIEVRSTNRRYLLVNADRYRVVPRTDTRRGKGWTDEKNARRCELIRKKFMAGISVDEERELAELQDGLSAYRGRAVSLPYDVVEELRAAVESSPLPTRTRRS